MIKRFNAHAIVFFGFLIIVLAFLSYKDANSQDTTLSTELVQAIRNADHEKITSILNQQPEVASHQDNFGNTPLILAALYADETCVQTLLTHGADVNAQNYDGVTALMNVSGSTEKAKLLLDAGAEVNLQSDIGNTALIRAAVYINATDLVELLIENQADINLCNFFGMSPLIAAAMTGSNPTIDLLLKNGAEVQANLPMPPKDINGQPMHPFFSGGQSALMWSALIGNETAVKQLLQHGANVNDTQLLGNALGMSTWRGETQIAQLLLEHGATVDQRDQMIANFTPLLWAGMSDTTDNALIDLLCKNGADVNAKGGSATAAFMEAPQTPLMLFKRQGKSDIISILENHGATHQDDPWAKRQPKPKKIDLPEDEIPVTKIVNAINQAIPPVEQAMLTSYQDFKIKKLECASCHSQYLPQIALSAMEKKGFTRDETVNHTMKTIHQKPFNPLGRQLSEPTFHPAPSTEFGYALMSAAESGVEADYYIDMYVNFVAANQAEDGRWYNYLPRPPIQTSDVGATAWGLQALALYPLPGRMDEMSARIEKAKQWLWQVEPNLTDDRVHQLLGLHWAGVPQEDLKPLAQALMAEQRDDGGWAQLPGLASDAYATGSVLYALHKAAGITPDDAAYQQGVRYLLRNQLEDGTWFVRRRAFPFQPTMDPGFPHGRDGWLSTAATSWALLALEPGITQDDTKNLDKPSKTIVVDHHLEQLPKPASKQVVYETDIQPLFDRACIACHSGDRPRSAYRLNSFEALMTPGQQGYQNITPGDSTNSPLLHYITGLKEDMEMPPNIVRANIPELTEEEIGVIRAWIEQGAGE